MFSRHIREGLHSEQMCRVFYLTYTFDYIFIRE